MAGVGGEATPKMLGCAPDLEVLGESLGEIFRREGLVIDASRICVDRGRERAALQEDEGCGRAGEVRIALQAVRCIRLTGEQIGGDQLAQGDLEDLQFVLEDEGE